MNTAIAIIVGLSLYWIGSRALLVYANARWSSESSEQRFREAPPPFVLWIPALGEFCLGVFLIIVVLAELHGWLENKGSEHKKIADAQERARRAAAQNPAAVGQLSHGQNGELSI